VDLVGAQALARNDTQQRSMERLIQQQAKWLAKMHNAVMSGFSNINTSAALSSDLDFSITNQEPQQLMCALSAALDEPQSIIALAKICCNASHQLQNLAAHMLVDQSKGKKGSKGHQGHKGLKGGNRCRRAKRVDNLAGKLENQSRVIMCVLHRDIKLGNNRLRHKMKILERCETIEQLIQQICQIARTITDGVGQEMLLTAERVRQAVQLCSTAARQQLMSGLPSCSAQPPPPASQWMPWLDSRTGRSYWHNTFTNETTWLDPSGPPPPPPN
jgi:hypothetical protein